MQNNNLAMPFPRFRNGCVKLGILGLMAFTLIGPSKTLAQAEPPKAEHPQGVWGTTPACESWRAGEERRPELQLYEIGPQWIQRHVFFCMIRPQMSFRAPDGRWQLDVVRGEDAREVGHFLTLDIREADALTVTWSTVGDPESFSFGPFERYDAQDSSG